MMFFIKNDVSFYKALLKYIYKLNDLRESALSQIKDAAPLSSISVTSLWN